MIETRQAASERFQQRGARAALLASSAESAREPLQFVSALCEAQSLAAEKIDKQTWTGHLGAEVERLLPLLEPVLRVAAERGPEALAIEAEKRLHDEKATARERLLVYWSGDGREDFLSRALLQPYAEVLRLHNATPDRLHKPGHCPFCGGAAWISTRKPAPDADSGFRFLHCSLCGLEWSYNRGSCPSCFEQSPEKLPVFRSEAYPAVRVEACETCRRYIKSIDLSLDARPIAIVDDLVSIAMDLWAVDEGFSRIEPGLAGL